MSDALRIAPNRRLVRVEVLFAEGIEVNGPHRLARNKFDIPPSTAATRIGLKYIFSPNVVVGSSVDVAVIVYGLRVVWWRVFIGVLLIAMAVIPSILKAVHGLSDVVTFGVGDAVIVSIPFFVVVATILVWTEAVHVAHSFLTREEVLEQSILEQPSSAGAIRIVGGEFQRRIAEWRASST